MGGSSSKPEPEVKHVYHTVYRDPPPRARTPSPPRPIRARTPSPPRPPTPPKVLSDTPWRYLSKSGEDLEQSILQDIKAITPLQNPNILLLGPVGAGKSSFINSLLSLGAGRKKINAKTGSSETSYTLEFKAYKDSGLLKHYRLLDCMGIEPKYGAGFHANDIFFLLQGHVKKNYQFDPEKPMNNDSEFYRKNPKFEQKTHCVVFVIDANTMHRGIPEEYVDKIKYLQDKIKKEDVPRVLILTHADTLCDQVRENPSIIFRSLKLEKTMKIASEVFSIELASIYPVINYEHDVELTTAKNIPLLLALRQIMNYASDRVEQVLNESESDESD